MYVDVMAPGDDPGSRPPSRRSRTTRRCCGCSGPTGRRASRSDARMTTTPGIAGPRARPVWLAVLVTIVGVLSVIHAARGVAATNEPPFPRPNGPVQVPEPINTTFPGLTTFRGNASRSYYGQGPVPTAPVVRWVYPSDGSKMCAMSAETQTGPQKEWCGTGWTGQPNVVPWQGGMQVREGAFDDGYHFLDAGSGTRSCRSSRPATWRRVRPRRIPTAIRSTTRARVTTSCG